MAISGVLAATFIFAIALLLIYVALALKRRIKPSFSSAFMLMANAAAVATSLRLLWLVFFESVQGLADQDKYYLIVGVVATGWYGCSRILKTFNKLYGVQLKEEDEEE